MAEDNVGLPHTQRIHTDDSIEVRWFNRPESDDIKDRILADRRYGCQYSGGGRRHFLYRTRRPDIIVAGMDDLSPHVVP